MRYGVWDMGYEKFVIKLYLIVHIPYLIVNKLPFRQNSNPAFHHLIEAYF
jgi:hypothetical protein